MGMAFSFSRSNVEARDPRIEPRSHVVAGTDDFAVLDLNFQRGLVQAVEGGDDLARLRVDNFVRGVAVVAVDVLNKPRHFLRAARRS
jgi:hypothetical protein